MMPLTAKRKSVVLGFSMPGHAWHAVAGAGSSSKHYRKPAKKDIEPVAMRGPCVPAPGRNASFALL